ncbi:MAG: hypothetical protein QN650_06475 [Nitrososphaeraceae archaeon]|nr:hypothetical protein [Nitrososphaeraceae archaeon]
MGRINSLIGLGSGHIFIIAVFIGLLALSITSNNYFINSTWAQIEIFSNPESDSIPITSEVSLDNGICDFNSENPFSSNALLEKLRDDFCDEDTDAIENDDEENDEEIRDQIRDAEDDDDDQGNDEDDQGNDEDDQGIGESDKLPIQDRIQNRLQELKDRLEKVLSEEEEEDQPLPEEEQQEVEDEDELAIKEHKAENDKDCRGGNVLEGASNAEDLKTLSECQEAVGEVVHTKKMDDGDYKFLLNVEDKYKYLLNEKNDEKTDGYLVVEIVPPDQGKSGVILPKEGDRVHVWGAWVTDKPKGWHEIHPAWKVIKQ